MVSDYFSDSYCIARQRFIKLATGSGAELKAWTLPGHTSPEGEPLIMDTAYFGAPSAEKLLLMICGTHGQEAQSGAACILQWIDKGYYHELPPNVAVLVVHGLNPYGWAWSSRSNENNVDLNRNFFDHRSHPDSPLYERFAACMYSNDISPAGIERVGNRINELVAEIGLEAAIQTLSAGQYRYPTALNYGGTEKEWSHQTLETLFEQYVHGKRWVYSVEWHTGLGEYAKPFYICQSAAGSAARDRAERCFGRDEIGAGENPHEVNVSYQGLLLTWTEQQVEQTGGQFCGAVIEWGTYDMDTVTAALLIDRWLRFECEDRDSPEAISAQTRMMELFSPTALTWRKAVLDQSDKIYRSMHANLLAER